MSDDFFAPKIWRAMTLEEALENLVLASDLCFCHTVSKTEVIESPAYILPVGWDENLLYGIFNLDGRLIKTPLAFTLEKTSESAEQKYYHLLNNFTFITRHHEEAVLYLPLSLTEYVTQLVRKDPQTQENKFIREKPFPIFGVEGLSSFYPLVLIQREKKAETEKSFLLKSFGLVQEPEKGLLIYQTNDQLDKKKMIEYLNRIRWGKMNTTSSGSSPADKLFKEDQKKKPDQARNKNDGDQIDASLLLGLVEPSSKDFGLELEEKLAWDWPQEIVKYLDRFVIGQDEAKKITATAFSLYMKRVKHGKENLLLPQGHILLVGPSGVGKTLIAEKLIAKANLPVAATSVTGKSGEGYVGESLSSVFKTIRQQTEEEAPFGIVFIDEIDKVIHETRNDAFFGQLQQDQMIGWLSGTYLDVGNHQKVDRLTTKNLLFFTAGAFEGLEGDRLAKIVAKRKGEDVSQISGFGREKFSHAEKRDTLAKILPEDLVAYGFRKELVRRLSFLSSLHPLTIDDKLRILKESEDSEILKYQNLFELEGYNLQLDEPVYPLIAEKSPPEIGASGLNVICQKLFFEIIFNPQEYTDDAGVIKVDLDLAEKLLKR